MEFVLQALTYPEIGEIIYTSAQVTRRRPSRTSAAHLPRCRRHRDVPRRGRGPVTYGERPPPRDPGGSLHRAAWRRSRDRLSDVRRRGPRQLGVNFATSSTPRSAQERWRSSEAHRGIRCRRHGRACEEPELAPELELVGTADTSWTQEGRCAAVSGLLAEHPDLAGISYEYADGFLGGIRATRPPVCLSTSCSPCGPMKWDCSANGPTSPIPISRSTSRRAEALTRGSP